MESRSVSGVKTVWMSILAILLGSEVLHLLYEWYNARLKKRREERRRNKRKFVTPPWAIRKAQELEPPKMSDEQIAALNLRKPPDVWNTVLFFPDPLPKRVDSPTTQLLNYFKEARTSILLCLYLCSHFDLTDVILRKFREGLLVQVVTDYDTWTAHNNCGIKYWKQKGIEVRLRANGHLMHNKFAIIDDEALLTGSLNWTKQGTQSNNENVMITTDQRVVSKYYQEFFKIYGKSKDLTEFDKPY